MGLRKTVVSALKRTHLIGVARRMRDIASPSIRLQEKRMVSFYRQFVAAGDLVFDVGANVGNRTAVFLKLGARVVAVEPQDACVHTLRQKFGKHPGFILVTEALSSNEGEGEIRVSDESTVSSMASDWIDSVKSSGRFGDIDWGQTQRVRLTTLDSLIRKHGLPAFCKIDVEGYEPVVLKGLSQRIPAISFEFTPEFFTAAMECVQHLSAIGYDRFNFSDGESMQLVLQSWLSAEAILRHLRAVPPNAFGDVYAM